MTLILNILLSILLIILAIIFITVFLGLFYLFLIYVMVPIFEWFEKHEILCYIIGIIIIGLALVQGLFYSYHIITTIGGM